MQIRTSALNNLGANPKEQVRNEDEAYIAYSKELFENKKSVLINIAFPGDHMTLYDYEKKEENKKGKSLSKYEYLQRRLKVFDK